MKKSQQRDYQAVAFHDKSLPSIHDEELQFFCLQGAFDNCQRFIENASRVCRFDIVVWIIA